MHQLKFLLHLFFVCQLTIVISQDKLSDTNWREIPGRDFGDRKWHEIMDDVTVTFQEVQKAFYKEWEDKNYEKGKGYKQFKRWEMTMRGRERDFIDMKQGKLSTQYSPKLHKSMTNANWTGIGPLPNGASKFFGIGRVDALGFDPLNSDVLYAGTPNGGIWKSINNGASWTIITDNAWLNQAIADICVNPNDGQNLFVATGNRDGGIAFTEEGIMKSTDGGMSWIRLETNTPTFRFYRLLMDPNGGVGSSNNNKLLLATNNGIYYSTDSGTTWNAATLPASVSGRNIYDMEYQPNNSNVVYATTDGILIKSTNGGQSFAVMTNVPFTDAIAGRTSIAVTADDPNAAYFMVSDEINNGFLGIYKYNGSAFSTVTDGTESVTWVNGDPYINANNLRNLKNTGCWGQIFYNWSFGINPTDKNDMTIGAICAFRSYDGGSSWQAISTYSNGGGEIHVDIHAVEYQPETSIPHIGSDGGAYQWVVDGSPWKAMYDMDISELYTLAVSETNPDHIICGAQDNGGFYRDGGPWLEIGAGDWLTVAFDPVDINVLYRPISSSDMRIQKSTDKGSTWKTMLQESVIGENSASVFVQPEIKLHPYLRHVIYSAFENVYQSVDGGDTWTNLSNGDIGSGFKSLLEIAPSDANYIYTSSSSVAGGGLYRSIDGGASWNNITWPVTSSFMSSLAISDINPNNVFVAMSNGKVYESMNGGNSWTDISNGLPVGVNFQIKYLHGSNKELYLAKSNSIYYKNGSANWIPYSTNLPNTYCRDIELMPVNDKAYVATYGRGVWESPLQNASPVCYTSVPSILPSGPICANGSAMLTSSMAPNGYGYQWYVDDQAISGATAQTYAATTDGNYAVRFTGNCKGFSSEMVVVGTGISIASYEESFETNVVFFNQTSDDIDWVHNTGPTFSNNTGPSAASHLDGYIYVESSQSNSPNKVAELVSDCYALTAFNSTVLLEFDSHLYGSTMGSLEVQISDNGTTWSSIYFRSGNQGDQWNNESVDISNYIGATVSLKFIAVTGSNFLSDIAIDHVRFSGTSNCPPDYANTNMLTGTQLVPTHFETDGKIESDQVISADVNYDSATSIELIQGFEVQISKVFHAYIDGCGGTF